MLTVRTILAVTDFSRCADAAVDLALDVARRHGAELRLLHVDEPNGSGRGEFGGGHPLSRAWKEDLDRTGRPREIRMVWDAVPVIAELRPGPDPTDVILDAVASYDVDLLVMGTHGQHSVRRFLNDTPDSWPIGLTAREVLSETRCPVLAVGPRHEHPVEPTREIVAGVDDSPLADEVLTTAGSLASFYGTPLRVVHVVPVGTGAFQIDSKRRDLALRAKNVVPESVPFEVHIPEGRPAVTLVRYVRHRPGALVVVASHGHRTRGTVRIGSVADAVVRSAPCPVITIKPYGKPLIVRSTVEFGRLAPVTDQEKVGGDRPA